MSHEIICPACSKPAWANVGNSKELFEEKGGILKFYPLIDQSDADQKAFITKNNLPSHPLQLCGYNSIGCYHCTKKGQGREGRWAGAQKTECGLH